MDLLAILTIAVIIGVATVIILWASRQNSSAGLDRRGVPRSCEFNARAEESGSQSHSQRQAPNNLKDFIRTTVVPHFNGQRAREYQFAVLILSENNINNIQSTKLENGLDDERLVDSSMISFPNHDQHLVNYVATRPDHGRNYQTVHAERILLDRFEALKEKCSKFSTILVYSWLMPCSECTEALIRKLHSVQVSKVIVYNTDQDFRGEENKNNRYRLHQAGIDVYQIRYFPDLPPISHYKTW